MSISISALSPEDASLNTVGKRKILLQGKPAVIIRHAAEISRTEILTFLCSQKLRHTVHKIAAASGILLQWAA